jgi:hypothetical protein
MYVCVYVCTYLCVCVYVCVRVYVLFLLLLDSGEMGHKVQKHVDLRWIEFHNSSDLSLVCDT